MKINTYIFDLDGTILDTLDDLTDAFNSALNRFGYKERTKEEFKSFVGNGVKKAIERALPQGVSEERLDDITNYFKETYGKNMTVKTKPYPGISELLSFLKKEGMKTAVVSNKFDTAVKKLCNLYFGELIDTATGECIDIRRKPQIDGVLYVCKELDSDIKECIYIGDSDTDILTGKNAGIPTISVLWGFRNKKFLLNAGAEYIAESPMNIIEIAKSI